VYRSAAEARVRKRRVDQLRYAFVRSTPDVSAKENARTRELRAQRRAEKLAVRPPCPRCGKPVTRDSKHKRAKVPVYCSKKCNRAAIWARYVEKNGQPRQRKKTSAKALEQPT
jgi:endogenous inhibitor of DNA gyrase (YacG/DUF329 family)